MFKQRLNAFLAPSSDPKFSYLRLDVQHDIAGHTIFIKVANDLSPYIELLRILKSVFV